MKFKTLTTLGDRSFATAAPQLWNSFPYAIRSSPSVASFKKTLKNSFSVDIIVLTLLEIFLLLSADENSNIHIGLYKYYYYVAVYT